MNRSPFAGRVLTILLVVFVLGFLLHLGLPQASAEYGERITIVNKQFMVGNQRIWMNGVNTPWQPWDTFGGGFDLNWWSTHFDQLKANNINAVRVWITCSGTVGILIDSNGVVSGATAAHWQDLDAFFQLAQEKQIYIMPTLIASHHFKAAYADRWTKMMNSNANIDSYINNYLAPFISRYKNNPYVWAIDLINEPDWATTSENGPISWTRMQMYFAKTSKYIHENSQILVTVGLAFVKYNSTTVNDARGHNLSDSALQAQVNSPNARLDFYSNHWYPWMYQAGYSSPFHKTPAQYGLPTDKLSMIGEAPGKGIYAGSGVDPCDYSGQTLLFTTAQAYLQAYQNGWEGMLAWSSNSADGAVSCGSLSNNIASGTNAFFNSYSHLVYPSAGSSSPTATPTAAPPTATPTAAPPTATPTAAPPTATPGGSTNARSGNWAARLVSSPNTWRNLHQVATVPTNTAQVASVWIKGSGQVQLVVTAGAWGADLGRVTCTASASYTLCSVNFNSGGNTQVGYRLTNNTSGQDMYLDDAFLGVAGGANALGNPGFEGGNTIWYVEAPFSIVNVN
jgi:hypothetical protein